ncbi:MAG TPA: flagellar protein FliS [Terriglobales bacterium]|jgi:flagellar biosynthetic protein FliS
MNSTDLAYRKTAVEGASGFGLLISLFDTLAGDLRRAAAAQRRKDLENRCHEVKHASLVIGFLENCLTRGVDGELAQQLSVFYSRLRRKLIEAQINQSAETFEREMAVVLRIREHLQKVELRNVAPEPQVHAAVAQPDGAAIKQAEGRLGSWSV